MTPSTTLATEAPLCAEPEFAALVEGLVADFAPRLFALVEEEGKRVDGLIVAWGMAFEDRAEVVGVGRAIRGSFGSAGQCSPGVLPLREDAPGLVQPGRCHPQ